VQRRNQLAVTGRERPAGPRSEQVRPELALKPGGKRDRFTPAVGVAGFLPGEAETRAEVVLERGSVLLLEE